MFGPKIGSSITGDEKCGLYILLSRFPLVFELRLSDIVIIRSCVVGHLVRHASSGLLPGPS